jgi:hypothetical protein
MEASDYVPISFKNRLHLAGRPQMSSRPSWTGMIAVGTRIAPRSPLRSGHAAFPHQAPLSGRK